MRSDVKKLLRILKGLLSSGLLRDPAITTDRERAGPRDQVREARCYLRDRRVRQDHTAPPYTRHAGPGQRNPGIPVALGGEKPPHPASADRRAVL